MLPPVPGLVPARKTLRPASTAEGKLLPLLQSAKLVGPLRQRIRYLHYSRRTEDACVFSCRAFIRQHGLRHPANIGGAEVEAFLSSLADERGLAPSTRRQALSALLFLYGKALGNSLP
jgi:hypothetical protein